MKRLLVLVAAMVLVLAVSCDTKNIGTPVGPTRGPVPTVTVPGTMNGAANADWTVTWIGGAAPYTIAMNMGGGTVVDVPAGTPAVSPFAQTFMMVNPSTDDPATYTYTVTVTDIDGMFGTATAAYTVGRTENIAPTIDDVTYAAPTLTVTVSDVDEATELTVTVTEPAGLTADATSKVATQVSGTVATFTWSATDAAAGGTGDTTITVTDSAGGFATATQAITISPFAPTPPADTLWACAPSGTGTVGGDPVRVVIYTGDLAAAEPFNFCDGVGFTVNDGADYAADTFNIGAPGGAEDDADGIWGTMSPAVTGFIMPQDWMMAWTAIPGDPDNLGRIDFSVAAIGGSGMTALTDGAIFNFGLEFTAAGTYDLGFQYFEGVRRTFYSGPDATTYEWDDIDNVNDWNTITVT